MTPTPTSSLSKSSAPALSVQGLRKRYGAVSALSGLDFALPVGQWWVYWGQMGRANRP